MRRAVLNVVPFGRSEFLVLRAQITVVVSVEFKLLLQKARRILGGLILCLNFVRIMIRTRFI